jgi:hypothetical protein
MVNFYDRLQEVSMNYALVLMPFDADVLSNSFEGLCPPRLGLLCYAAMCKALMELLPWLIPSSVSPQVNATLASVRYEMGNGYNYLWSVLELTVPGFDPTKPIQAPAWSKVEDIFQFAQDYLLFFHLWAKLNFHYDDRTQSGLFLCAVQSSRFADTVTLLQLHINLYQQESEDGYLPPNLCLRGLANSIHQNAQARLRDIATPCAWRIKSDLPCVQDIPSIYHMKCSRSEFGNQECRRNDYDNTCTGRFQPPDSAATQDWSCVLREPGGRFPRGPGCLAHPDCNRQSFLPDKQCAAC